MAEIAITETCACGATFRATGNSYRSMRGGGTNNEHRSAEEMAERWRTDHRHVEPVAPSPRAPREEAKPLEVPPVVIDPSVFVDPSQFKGLG